MAKTFKLRFGDESGAFWQPPVVEPPGARRSGVPRVVVTREPASDWSPPCADDLPRLRGGAVFGLDTETRDEGLRTGLGPGWAFPDMGHIAGVSLAWGHGPAPQKLYWPVRHEGGDNLEPGPLTRCLEQALGDPTNTVVMHNAPYDWGWLRRAGYTVRCRVVDTMATTALLDEYRDAYNLDAVALDVLGLGKDERLLRQAAAWLGLHAKKDLWRFPARFVGGYAAVDAERTLQLWYAQYPRLLGERLEQVLALELAQLPIAIEMRWRGVRVDLEAAQQLNARWQREEQAAQALLNRLAGFAVNVNEEQSLSKLYRAAGVTPPKTKTGKDSFTRAWLTAQGDPVSTAVQAVRKVQKLRGTFVESYVLNRARAHGDEWRLHGSFHPLKSEREEGGQQGAVSGRYSSSDPNLQNIVSKDKDPVNGVLLRSLYLPEKGQLWASNDFKQQEPKLAVHFALLLGARGAQAAADAYRLDPKTDFHQFVADLTGLERYAAKQLNLAIMYGMGGARVCHQLGLPTKWVYSKRQGRDIEVAGDAGAALLATYHAKLPFMGDLRDGVAKHITDRQRGDPEGVGYLRTLLGRRARFGRKWGYRASEHKGVNRLIQGSAADQGKAAMVALWDLNVVPLAVVHDEACLSVTDRAQAAHYADVMAGAVTLQVPSTLDVELGANWGVVK